jgi:hypothetical protein
MKSSQVARDLNIALAKKPEQEGFVLPLILAVGLIIGIGIVALSARTFSGLIGSIRQGQSREAKEAAESGAALILKELNRNYPYLLIENCEATQRTGTPDCAGWKSAAGGGTFRYRTSICPNSYSPPETILPKLAKDLTGGRGRYRLVSYTYSGDQHQGGTGRLRVLGEKVITNSNGTTTRAAAYLEEELSILPKNCNVPVNTPSTSSGFPGLLASTVTIGNNDVLGAVNGNVLCTSCDPNGNLKSQMGVLNNGVVNGNLYGGQIALPDVPTFPPMPAGVTPPTAIAIGPSTTNPLYRSKTTTEPASYLIEAGLTSGINNGGACYTDSQLITHCKVSSINLSGNEPLKIISTGSRGVRLYVSGNITIGPQASIIHDGSPADLGIFGLPSTGTATCTQTVTLNGGATTSNAFIFFPNGCVGINGGSQNPDIRGAIWALKYDGSSSNRVEIEVPENMGSILYTRYGTGFGIGVREFAALGINKWMSVQLP